MTKIPNLSISSEKVFFVISKARQSEIEADEPELIAEFTDDDAAYGRKGSGKSTDRAELSSFIRGLNVDEQIDLVALTWLGRGDGEVAEWDEMREEALRLHNNRTAQYLLGKPMLADHLEEGLSQLGYAGEDYEH